VSYLFTKELKPSKYRLLGLVGQGQFGRVYCASHRKTGRLFALKELDKYRFPTHKFLREFRFLLSLQHANIVTCHALEHTPTGRYLVMDYCEGGTLRSLMEDDLRLHPAQGLKLVMDLLFGLDHAHSRGIVHCDVKPENILLMVQAYGWTARISDFGIARLHQENAGDDSGNTGSPAYMAPERFYGQYSSTSDLYAVGIILFELLVGYRPFSGLPAAMMSAHLNQPVKIPDAIPIALQAVILTALQKLPARRFQSAAQMLAAVQTAAQEAQLELEHSWADSRLLRSPLNLPPRLCPYVRQEALQAEVQQLITVPGVAASASTFAGSDWGETNEQVYQVSKRYIGCRTDPGGFLDDGSVSSKSGQRSRLVSVRLPKAVKELLIRPQGCFAMTQRSIYRIPSELFQPGVAQDAQTLLPVASIKTTLPPQSVPELVTEFNRDFLATIEAKGRWMTVAVLEPDQVTRILSFWNLSRMQALKLADRNGNRTDAPRLTAQLFHLVMVDSRYTVAFSHIVDQSTHSCITGVLLEIFTRRGSRVSVLSLPVPLRQLVSAANPYQLMALEPGHTHSVLLIDLKPLKLLRVGVDIVPLFLASSSWGYILMAADGQIVLLDRYSQVAGCFAGPANPTAIAVLEPYGLLIATWENGEGTLYTIDLRQLDVKIVF
jgi:serine/threonine protein kinase